MSKNRTNAQGDTKISVDNGSRNIDLYHKGQWLTINSLPDDHVPAGIYHLADATKAGKNVHPQIFGGQILHFDQKSVYQLSGAGIVSHERRLFIKEPVVGQSYEVEYRRGIGIVKGEISQVEGYRFHCSVVLACKYFPLFTSFVTTGIRRFLVLCSDSQCYRVLSEV